MKELTLIVTHRQEKDKASKNASSVERKEFVFIEKDLAVDSVDRILRNIHDIRMLTLSLRGLYVKTSPGLAIRHGGQTKEGVIDRIDFLCDEIYTEQIKLIKALPSAK